MQRAERAVVYSAATVQYGRYSMAALIKAFSESFICFLSFCFKSRV